MKLPQKITPCPILESIIEIRFEPSIPRDAVFGMVYHEVSKKYTDEFERLPILQLPEPIRIADPNFQFSPEYRLRIDNLSFSIGPQVLSISCVAPYIGWTNFSSNINEILELFNKSNVVKTINRFGFRCINFFDNNIFNNIKLNISLNNKKLNFRTTIIECNQLIL